MLGPQFPEEGSGALVATARRLRHPAILLICGVALAAAICLSLALGARDMSLATALHGLFAPLAGNIDDLAVQSRIPRTLAGVLVGVSLGLAGALMQGVARNPLADPGILGINAGAALFVVVAISFLGITTVSGYIWFAFLGAGVAAVVVYSVAAIGRVGATPVKLALAGAAVTAALGSLVTAILLTSQQTLDSFRFWQVGALAGRTLESIATVLPFLIVGTVLALASGRMLNVLALGDDLGRGLGQRVAFSRLIGAVAVIILSGGATALAGPIAFVGLIIPHIARMIGGSDYRWILPISALLGPVLLLSADVVGRIVGRPGEIQVGIITALIGAPVFVFLVRYRKMASL